MRVGVDVKEGKKNGLGDKRRDGIVCGVFIEPRYGSFVMALEEWADPTVDRRRNVGNRNECRKF